jgi:Ni2+-binding GTPase involved in maturation of urease and hydrogenase
VGGFLGAGKTSLILAAAKTLEARGVRCAAILNDQGKELVDRHHAASRGLMAREVAGGCFCCRLSGLVAALEELRAMSPDVIFAEPVGSCTDIAATVLAPLIEDFDRYRVAPFTVLVDPSRAAALLSRAADPDLSFLFEKQLQEADLVCLTKSDLYPEDNHIPGLAARRISAVTGQGVEAWLNEILVDGLPAGKTILDIDYARYAQAEASLAWLNLRVVLECAPPITATAAVGPFMDRLDRTLAAEGIETVHLKIFASSAAGWIKAALCAPGQEPRIEGNLDASPAARQEVVVNLRAKGDPEQVRQIVTAQLELLPGRVVQAQLDCFSPAAPQPERRIPQRSYGFSV